MNKTLGIVLGIAVLIVLGFGGLLGGQYNSLVQGQIAVKTQWGQVEVVYQRRFDLVPNLVEAVKGFMTQEQTILKAIADARTKYSGTNTPEGKIQAANQLETALSRLLVIVENYPQLKSSELFQNLMAQIEGTENRINVERRKYNETVQNYNLKIRQFPSNIFAGFFGFKETQLFQASSEAETAPKVDFNTPKNQQNF